MGERLAILLLLATTGCLRDHLVACDDGRQCPANTVCDEQHQSCVAPAQLTACENHVAGDLCTTDVFTGICADNVCIAGCGDGQQSPGEECDDGNFKSHDGCSSSCVHENATWSQWKPDWLPRTSQAAVYDTVHHQLLVLGGSDELGAHSDQWARTSPVLWQRDVKTLPGARTSLATAYDSTTGHILAFGGINGAERYDTTWDYDGTQWNVLAPATSPPAREGAGLVFDPTRHRFVLFGGRTPAYLDDTWEFDPQSTTWTQIAAATRPPPRAWATFVWDSDRQRAILFGGTHGSEYRDLWEYNPAITTWTQIPPAVGPPGARYGHASAYLPSTTTRPGRVIVFGGSIDGVNVFSDTWEYTPASAAWTASPRMVAPPGRMFATLTYDPDRDALVLVNGLGANDQRLDDVWELTPQTDGTLDWVSFAPAVQPSSRQAFMTYDAASKQTVLFGGRSLGVLGDTWTFDGTRWTMQTPAHAPPPRDDATIAYDSTRARTVLYGGRSVNAVVHYDDTWEWDGALGDWTQTATGPPPRYFASAVDDPTDGALVLFGGIDQPTVPPLGDTWEYTDTWTMASSAVSPAPQAVLAMAYDAKQGRIVAFDSTGTTYEYVSHQWRVVDVDVSPTVIGGMQMVYDPWSERVVLFSPRNAAASELWLLDTAGWRRTQLLGTQPGLRVNPGFAVLPALRALVLFGGSGLDDTWLLRYVSETPDEDCTNGTDDDGDSHVDAADPDCD